MRDHPLGELVHLRDEMVDVVIDEFELKRVMSCIRVSRELSRMGMAA
jgi:hypothetical protein